MARCTCAVVAAPAGALVVAVVTAAVALVALAAGTAAVAAGTGAPFAATAPVGFRLLDGTPILAGALLEPGTSTTKVGGAGAALWRAALAACSACAALAAAASSLELNTLQPKPAATSAIDVTPEIRGRRRW